MNFIRICFAITFLILPIYSFSAQLELDCRYKYTGKEYDEFLTKTKDDNSEIAQQLKSPDRKTLFLVDTTQEKVLAPWTSGTVKITPDSVEIYEYMSCEDNPETKSVENCKDKNGHYLINTVDGKLTGDKYAGDDTWEPYFKKGDLMFQISGTCTKLEKKS